MEKEFYNENFEQLLKEATEDFKMYPSRKVWHSLYNDLHPAKRWPSLAVCLLLITSILYVGVTNNNSINHRLISKSADLSQPVNTIAASEENSNTPNQTYPSSPFNNYKQQLAEQERVKDLLSFNLAVVPGPTSEYSTSYESKTKSQVTNAQEPRIETKGISEADMSLSVPANTIKPDISFEAPGLNENKFDNSLVETPMVNPLENLEKTAKNLPGQTPSYDKAWIDNYAFYNRVNKGKWKDRSTLSYYITPSIGFRTIKNDGQEQPAINSAMNSTPVIQADENVDHLPSINLEAGASLAYSLSKRLRVKGGVQFNVSNYKINAYELRHPAQTTLLLRDHNSGNLSLHPYNTSYANSPALSSSKLNNKIVQVSVPVGIDYRIAGTNRVQWFAGATIQPSYVTTGNVFIISSDRKFYVNDNSFMRRFNMNSSFETFVSYKTNSGITLNAGPQVRYQLFSTYTKQINYTENAYNIGLKLGISRNF